MIEAKIVLDSVSPTGKRITSFELVYPRFIHSELMTHRHFSRNAASSRAIPVRTMIADLRRSVAMPVHWGKNQPGMQAREQHDAPIYMEEYVQSDHDVDLFHRRVFAYTKEKAWLRAAEKAIEAAEAFDAAGYHKQIVNRVLEPFMHMRVLVTSTEYSNFFALRCHPDAQPEFQELARKMKAAYDESVPTFLDYGEWHLPYVNDSDYRAVFDYVWENGGQVVDPTHGRVVSDSEIKETLLKVSVARCARVSYKTHDNKIPTIEKDLELYDRLVGSVPLHASPTEHQATPDRLRYNSAMGEYYDDLYVSEPLHGNFIGWKQYRKSLAGECQ